MNLSQIKMAFFLRRLRCTSVVEHVASLFNALCSVPSIGGGGGGEKKEKRKEKKKEERKQLSHMTLAFKFFFGLLVTND